MPNLAMLTFGAAFFGLVGAGGGQFLCGLLEKLIVTKPSTAPPAFATVAAPILIGGAAILVIFSLGLSLTTLSYFSLEHGFWSDLVFILTSLIGSVLGYAVTILRYLDNR